MKRGVLLSLATLVALSTLSYAEPGDFGVNGPDAWNQPLLKRLKHTDAFGDTYYTFTYEKPKWCVAKEVKRASKKLKKQQAPKEILEGLNATIAALSALQKNDPQTAQKDLQKATELFDTALKQNPNLKLVPIDATIEVNELDASPNDIKADLRLAMKLLKKYKTQLARAILMPMQDEIDIIVHYIPMDLYPKATKKALELLKQGKKKEAIAAIMSAIDTIEATQTVIPIPLLTAQALVESASKEVKKDPKAATKHLLLALTELRKAKLLGYSDFDPKAYHQIYKEIVKLKNEIKAHHKSESLFEKLKKDIEELLNRHRASKQRLSSSDSVWKGTAKAKAAAAKEELNDKVRFLEKMRSNDF